MTCVCIWYTVDTHLIHSWYTFETQLIHIWNTLKYKTATLWYGIDLLLHKHTKIGGKVGQTFESMLHGCGKIQHKVHIYGKVLGNPVLHLHIVLPSYKQTIRWNFQHSVYNKSFGKSHLVSGVVVNHKRH